MEQPISSDEFSGPGDPTPQSDPTALLPQAIGPSTLPDRAPPRDRFETEEARLKEAARRQHLVETFNMLREKRGMTVPAAAKAVGADQTTLWRYKKAFEKHGFDGLVPKTYRCGRKAQMEFQPEELAAVKKNYLTTNRTRTAGSVPEAVRMAARKGEIRPEMAEQLFERERTGDMVPESIARDIRVPAAFVKQHRNPTDANLDYLNAPGSSMWITDPDTGEERFLRAGDVLEPDDATINFPVCIPWEIGGCPTSERYGVKVARFQWLVAIDAATRFVPGYSYTARPKSSYRAEDIVALYGDLFKRHGVWRHIRSERASWEALLVLDLLTNLDVRRITAWSPHQKPYIEGLFNLIWTKLSDMPGQVGRFRGEMEEENKVLTSCQRGATDPREFFPMLDDAIAAFNRALTERNSQPVKSELYGSWIPQERWLTQRAAAEEAGAFRRIPEGCEWMFSPCVRQWMVKGNTVGGSVQIMPGYSLRFDFAADWLPEHAGQTLKLHFDPAAPDDACVATITKHGRVLGEAVQVNKVARYARRSLGWGVDRDLGLEERKRAARAMRREVRIIGAGGEIIGRRSEAQDGLGNSVRIESGRAADGATAPMPKAAPVRKPTALASEEEFRRQAARLERSRRASALIESETFS